MAVALFCGAALSGALAQLETRAVIPTALGGLSLAVGDFNRDGKLDFAVADNNLQVFLGNGDGTFRLPVNYLIGTGPISVAAADLNGDGKLDLAVAALNVLFVVLGNGDGTFQTPAAYTTACIPTFVATGDFAGDKKLGLLVTYSSGNCPYVSIFLGNGDGTFQQTPINTSPSYSPAATGIGDFNGDGKLDLAVAEQFGAISQVEILMGNGDGTFSSGASYSVGPSPVSVAVTDFRNNGKLDLAVACLSGITAEFLGNGDGTFKLASTSPTSGAQWVTMADLNGDGKPDLAVSELGNPGVSGVAVILNNGDGTFQSPTHYPAGKNDPFVAAGDFNGDHKTDLIVADYANNDAIVLLNAGVVSFSPITPVNYPYQLIGTTSLKQAVTLTNTGATTLSISSITAHGPFKESNTCGASVAAGAKCTISMAFKPKSMGNVSGTVSIVDSASSKPQFIDLTGAGTVVGFSPNTLNFAPQKVGTTSAPQTVTMTNHGTAAVSVTKIFIGGENFRVFSQTNSCPSSLSAGASCAIAVTFSPTKTGKFKATVSADDSGGGSPQSMNLAGTGD